MGAAGLPFGYTPRQPATVSIDSRNQRNAWSGSPPVLRISGLLPEDDVATLKAVGYDGHMRRPSSLWGFVQALQIFYAY